MGGRQKAFNSRSVKYHKLAPPFLLCFWLRSLHVNIQWTVKNEKEIIARVAWSCKASQEKRLWQTTTGFEFKETRSPTTSPSLQEMQSFWLTRASLRSLNTECNQTMGAEERLYFGFKAVYQLLPPKAGANILSINDRNTKLAVGDDVEIPRVECSKPRDQDWLFQRGRINDPGMNWCCPGARSFLLGFMISVNALARSLDAPTNATTATGDSKITLSGIRGRMFWFLGG